MKQADKLYWLAIQAFRDALAGKGRVGPALDAAEKWKQYMAIKQGLKKGKKRGDST